MQNSINPLDATVAISNTLVEACYELSMREKKLIWLILSKIQKSYKKAEPFLLEGHVEAHVAKLITEKVEFSITVEEFAKLYNMRPSDIKVFFLEASKDIVDRYIVLETKEDGKNGTKMLEKFHWFSGMRYDLTRGIAYFRFTEEVLSYIQQLSANFSKFSLRSTAYLKSSYSTLLYDYLVAQKMKNPYNKGKISVSLDKLYFVLGFAERKEEFKSFNRRILQPSIKDIELLQLRLIDSYCTEQKLYFAKERKVPSKIKLYGFNEIKLSFVKTGKAVTGVEFELLKTLEWD
jgi:plasmid replication initiation protein